jgi:2-polyprenyl-6-methoxyphenol hydroxylase-like FAD-dependent oxidoreductase
MASTHRSDHYDAVIVGARAAGAATGLLLARAGLDVLVVDRSQHGDDTLSTHALMRGGVLQLHRWGVLPRIVAAGTPPVRRTTFHIGDEPTPIDIKASHGVDALYAPRRTVLDAVLADTAIAAGAEIRYGTTVTGLRRDGDGRVTGITGRDADGRSLDATAAVTIGADGMSSQVAYWVTAPLQRAGTSAASFVYGYWDGLPADGYNWFFRPGAAAGVIPTNGSQACVFVGTTPERFRRDLLRNPVDGYLALLDETAPEFRERLADAGRPDTLHRFPGRVGYLRRPWGPGWALVGDAGYFKDPIAAHGLTDAMRDAELLARAVIDVVTNGVDEAAALGGYETTRNRLSERLLTIADVIASFTWDTTEVAALLLQLAASMTEEVETLASLDMDAPALAG